MENKMTFLEKVEYFNALLKKNMENAKDKETTEEKEKAVFNNISINEDHSEITFFMEDIDYEYTMSIDGINICYKKALETKSDDLLIYAMAVYYIPRLIEYSNKEISFEDFTGIRKETNPVVKDILIKKNNISEQLRLLRKYRDLKEVQDYINDIYNEKYCSEYVKYLIDKYYYNKKDLIKPEKNGLECMGKLLLS